jgi:hypothetical protein
MFYDHDAVWFVRAYLSGCVLKQVTGVFMTASACASAQSSRWTIVLQ